MAVGCTGLGDEVVLVVPGWVIAEQVQVRSRMGRCEPLKRLGLFAQDRQELVLVDGLAQVFVPAGLAGLFRVPLATKPNSSQNWRRSTRRYRGRGKQAIPVSSGRKSSRRSKILHLLEGG